MQTNLSTNNGANTSTNTSAGNAVTKAGGDAPSELFTTLLVAQIKNQNPLEPADPSEFVGQLTQLSQMEALQKLVSQGSGNAAIMENMQLLSLGAQVGSQVGVRTDSLKIGTDTVKGSFTLASSSASTAVVLTDVAGRKYRIEMGTQNPGEVPFKLDPVALGVPAGQYTLSVDAASGEVPGVDVVGELQSVKLGSNGVVLRVAGLGEVSSSMVTAFNGRLSPSS
ncbi:MAG TPA: flagellar hook capping FlgD N-terminal domain-containing protein [Rhodocyclaceae bacterium]|nr:flagellar hook capping FlgD N-terminal domain-containing protein [Rhodocyclaceae bacterium]